LHRGALAPKVFLRNASARSVHRPHA
jgi:hypothetical protein